MKVSVVIPAINESEGIESVIKSCWPYEVIVVDGGSTDGTQEIASKAGAKVLNQPVKGYGLALLTGFASASGDIIVTLDGDGTYPVNHVSKMVDILIHSNLDFISGNRFPLDDRLSMSNRNKFGNYVLSLTATILWDIFFKDILSGMWVFKKEFLNKLKIYSTGWNLSQEIKIESANKGNFLEYKIPYFHRKGRSKLPAWKVGFQNLLYLFIQRLGLRKLF